MNHALIATLMSLGLAPQSDPQHTERCDRGCRNIERCRSIEDASDLLGQDPEDAEEEAEAAEAAAEEAREAAEEAAEQSLLDAEEAAERAAEEAEEAAANVDRFHPGASDALRSARARLHQLLETTRSSEGSARAEGQWTKELAQAERALALAGRSRCSQSRQRAMEFSKDHAELAQVLARQGVVASRTANQGLELLSRLGLAATAESPQGSGRDESRSRSLEDRIQALEQRLGVENGDDESLEKRVLELERQLERSERVGRRSPSGATPPGLYVMPGLTGQTVVIPANPSHPGVLGGQLHLRHGLTQAGEEAAPDPDEIPEPDVWFTEAPTPPAAPDVLGASAPRTPRPPRWSVASAPPSAPATPRASEEREAPRGFLRQPSAGAQNLTPDRRSEIASLMQRMREEMERLREEMNSLRDEMGSAR